MHLEIVHLTEVVARLTQAADDRDELDVFVGSAGGVRRLRRGRMGGER